MNLHTNNFQDIQSIPVRQDDFLPANNGQMLLPLSKYILKDLFYKEYSFYSHGNSTIDLNNKNEKGLYFIFCWDGAVQISLNHKNKSIEEFQSAIIHNSEREEVYLTLNKERNYRFCIIGFNHNLDIANSTYAKCKEAFFHKNPSEIQIFNGPPYLKLIESIDNLSEKVKMTSPSEFIMEGLFYQILGLKLEHLLEAVDISESTVCTLTANDLKRVKLSADKIKENPSFEYTIEYLCNETGLSPFKLQEGFKQIYNSTAIDYVRDMRLEKAVELIKTTDLNISQIVYTIGLTSRSYFSKIFKNKYKCSPRIFKNKNLNSVLFL